MRAANILPTGSQGIAAGDFAKILAATRDGNAYVNIRNRRAEKLAASYVPAVPGTETTTKGTVTARGTATAKGTARAKVRTETSPGATRTLPAPHPSAGTVSSRPKARPPVSCRN
jgi:hypothetical protein